MAALTKQTRKPILPRAAIPGHTRRFGLPSTTATDCSRNAPNVANSPYLTRCAQACLLYSSRSRPTSLRPALRWRRFFDATRCHRPPSVGHDCSGSGASQVPRRPAGLRVNSRTLAPKPTAPRVAPVASSGNCARCARYPTTAANGRARAIATLTGSIIERHNIGRAQLPPARLHLKPRLAPPDHAPHQK